MIELSKANRSALKQLPIPKEEVCIWACVEGTMGRAWVNQLENPQYGLVAVADFCFLLGEAPETMNPVYIKLLETYGKNQIISFESDSWLSVIKKYFATNYVAFQRYAFYWNPESFDRIQLESYLAESDKSLELVAFDEELGKKALEKDFTADFCMFYESPQAFMEKGLGFAYVKDGEILAGASSYSSCEGAIDITIGTVESYRRKGLALICASKLILTCLAQGVYPRWDAANLGSVALAEKLGYQYKGEYTVYTIRDTSHRG